MPGTRIQQDTQIINSHAYDDNLSMPSAESAVSLEQDLNYIRTQLRIISGKANWYDPLSDSFDLTDIHDKRMMYWVQKTDDVAVPASQNYVLLTGAAKPSGNVAISDISKGTVVAQLAGSIGSHNLSIATRNGNVLQIRLASTNQPIVTSGLHEIYALLQVGSEATDGNPFGGTGSDDQAQLSFVYFDPATEAAVACSVSDIQGKTIEYAYRVRTDFYGLPEDAYMRSSQSASGGGGGLVPHADTHAPGGSDDLLSRLMTIWDTGGMMLDEDGVFMQMS